MCWSPSSIGTLVRGVERDVQLSGWGGSYLGRLYEDGSWVVRTWVLEVNPGTFNPQ